MALDNVKMNWSNDYVGEMTTPTGTIAVGDQPSGMQPYHMLFGALGGCFYSTFLVISEKKRVSFARAEVEISGEKPTIPGEVTTLSHVKILMTVYQPSDKAKIIQSADLATRNCSIHKTIATAAKIDLEVRFVD